MGNGRGVGLLPFRCFIDSKALFDALWNEWYDTTLYLTAKEMKLNDILYEEVFKSLSTKSGQHSWNSQLCIFPQCIFMYLPLFKSPHIIVKRLYIYIRHIKA